MKKVIYCMVSLLATCNLLSAQQKPFTHADTLRGTITPERAWWDVLKYDIWVKPDYDAKTIVGSDVITFKTLEAGKNVMQIDLQPPLIIDSMVLDHKAVPFEKKDVNAWYATVSAGEAGKTKLTKSNVVNRALT